MDIPEKLVTKKKLLDIEDEFWGEDGKYYKFAARYCKYDLVSEMVQEFPELQGIMGAHYGEKFWGLHEKVVEAIRDHYKPNGSKDEADIPVGLAAKLAFLDKIDSLVGFLHVEEPSGSKDPYKMRRLAIDILKITKKNNIPDYTIQYFIAKSILIWAEQGYKMESSHAKKVWDFIEKKKESLNS